MTDFHAEGAPCQWLLSPGTSTAARQQVQVCANVWLPHSWERQGSHQPHFDSVPLFYVRVFRVWKTEDVRAV